MATSSLQSSYFESSSLFGAQLEFVFDEASRLGRLCKESAQGFRLGSNGPLPVGVVFFLSLPFMGVMLFPSFVLGNASGGSGVLLTPFSPFSPLLSLSLLSSPSPSFFHSLFLSFSISLLLFLLSLFLSFPFPSPSPPRLHSFFFKGTACTVYFRDVRDDTADCNQLYLHWNKENFSFFLPHEFVYSDVNNFFVRFLAELSVFLLSRCPASDLRGY